MTGVVIQLLKEITDALSAWAQDHRGRCVIAQDPFHVMELLAESPAGFRVIVHWAGDEAESSPWSGITRNKLEVILSHNRGLMSRSGNNLIEPRAGQESLLALLDDLRSILRSIEISAAADQTNPWLEYGGAEPFVTPDGIPLDAYRTTWRVTSRLWEAPE